MRILKISIIVIFILIFGSVSLAFGRANIPEPSDDQQTLVIGMMTHQGKGHQTQVSLNGTNNYGIELTIQELTGGQTYTMRTNTDGSFFSVNVPEGTYKITRLFLKKEIGRQWASITWTTPSNVEHKFEIINGKVNNFGIISWETIQGERNYIYYNREYERVRDSFQANNNASKWNERDWLMTNITRVNL